MRKVPASFDDTSQPDAGSGGATATAVADLGQPSGRRAVDHARRRGLAADPLTRPAGARIGSAG